jgi:hypothetical protein
MGRAVSSPPRVVYSRCAPASSAPVQQNQHVHLRPQRDEGHQGADRQEAVVPG